MKHEEAGAFAAQAEAQLADRLTAVAGRCGPGSLHFINGIFEANRNRAPVILIASQIIRDELGFDFIQEVDFKQVYRDCSVFCDMIHTPEQARRKTVIACQTALAKRGVAVLIVPADISASAVDDNIPYAVHVAKPVTRPNDADLDAIADILNASENVVLYGGSGCQGAHQEILAVADRLKAPIAHTSRAKDFLEFDNPYNIGMTGMLGNEAGYHALLDCEALLMRARWVSGGRPFRMRTNWTPRSRTGWRSRHRRFCTCTSTRCSSSCRHSCRSNPQSGRRSIPRVPSCMAVEETSGRW